MKIIAESAFNHNGNIEYLKLLAKASKDAGADFFTVQVMSPKDFCTLDYSKSKIYHENSFSETEWIEVFDYCKEIHIDVIPCVLEEQSFKWCYDYGHRFLKLHATDITNLPFLKIIKEKGDCRLILETQCSTFQDISLGLEIIGDYVEVIFHGYSNYPTEIEDLNLNAIKALQLDFPGFKYGIADHSPTKTEIPILALGLGFDYIEKHITITRNNRNFDWQVSLYPEEFSQMAQSLKLYEKALGKNLKHPVKNELAYRNIIFKKVIENEDCLKRSDEGKDFLQNMFDSFPRTKIGVALIARLKSQRLKRKVLKPFLDKTIIEDLFARLRSSNLVSVVKLATSNLEEDVELAEIIGRQNSFTGHAVSVLDRMLSFAREEGLGGVFRVTGDNPFTDIALIDQMSKMFIENDLDYVRANNVPFGVSAELFSTSFLWNMYLKMENPLNSEYLSWFVLNDTAAKKGCINFIPENRKVSLVNLSVDYPEDYERVKSLLEAINKNEPTDITLSDIIRHADLSDIMDDNKIIKLPEGEQIVFRDYLQMMNTIPYNLKMDLYERDIHNR